MKEIIFSNENFKELISEALEILKNGGCVAYPTDTSYGLAVDATNISAVENLYKIKGRDFVKPIHIIPSNLEQISQLVIWNELAEKIANKFWPGPITLILPLKSENEGIIKLSASSGGLGIRMPDNFLSQELAKSLGRPITTTSANISGNLDCYSGEEVINQFKEQELKPDLIINAGSLEKIEPSTMLKIIGSDFEIIRPGPITEEQILELLK